MNQLKKSWKNISTESQSINSKKSKFSSVHESQLDATQKLKEFRAKVLNIYASQSAQSRDRVSEDVDRRDIERKKKISQKAKKISRVFEQAKKKSSYEKRSKRKESENFAEKKEEKYQKWARKIINEKKNARVGEMKIFKWKIESKWKNFLECEDHSENLVNEKFSPQQ